ncbi:MAG: orotidine-5'-phosphate decarboxylase [Bacillaceae bacterium]|nr:orotidine-5'-phosphate decarboxylase [Bacillaceae bacterium]
MAKTDWTAEERMIVALDFPGTEEAVSMMDQLSGTARYVKIGMQLYYLAGPSIVEEARKRGFSVFLDLKVHDIPNTARGAMQSLAGLGVDMVNVHVAGGKAMMEAAREGLAKGTGAGQKPPLLLGVTQLTSTSRIVMNEEIGIPGSVEDCVRHYALLARDSGLDGVVASPLEVSLIKESCGDPFLTVTPGVRPATSEKGDQHRITTPEDAFRNGTDFIVVGRPVTRAEDPLEAFTQIAEEVKNAIASR